MSHPLFDSRGSNFYRADPGLAASLRLSLTPELFAHAEPWLDRLGALAGGPLDELATTADQHPPVLHPRNRRGEDHAWIEKHPAYREMERVAFAEFGLAAMSHRGGVLGWPEPLPPALKYALSYLLAQAEFGLCCPLSMTDALTRTLRRFGSPQLVARYLPGLCAEDLDAQLQGAMFMTEQGAGSDVGATATRAVRDLASQHNAEGAEAWRLYGDKWFCSNPDAALSLVLARPDGGAAGTRGLGLFLLPRALPDGTPNTAHIVRLKSKLGTRSMASGEVMLNGAVAFLVGDVSRGFVQMADMINASRLSNGMRAAALMRRAFFEALHGARHRQVFGRALVELPLAQRQLMKIRLAAEEARTVMFAAARAMQAADAGDEAARQRLRILTPLLKFRACRDARRATGDAMEMRGGAGYIEEWPDARLVRDAHLGSIWEGTSNIVALDVLRAMRREGAHEALAAELEALHAEARAPDALRHERQRAFAFAKHVAAVSDDEHARQAASGLYHASAATYLAWEAQRIGGVVGAQRTALSHLVLTHKLSVRDPLAASAQNSAHGGELNVLLED